MAPSADDGRMAKKRGFRPQRWIVTEIEARRPLTQDRVAQILGKNRSSLHRVIVGDSKFPPEYCAPLAHLFDTTIDDIARRAGLGDLGLPPSSTELMVRKLTLTDLGPVLSNKNVATIQRGILSPANRGAIEMPDNTMLPRIHPGDWVIYHRTAIPRVGQYVVAFLPTKVVLVRELVEVTGPVHRLQSLHPRAIRDDRPLEIHPVIALIIDPLANA